MAKKNDSTYTVVVFATGTMTLTGKIVNQDDNHVVFQHKKKRSSKMLETPIARSNIIALVKAKDKDDDDSVTLHSTRVVVDEYEGSNIKFDEGFITFTDEDGNSVTVSSANAEVQSELDGATKPAKKTAAKKAAKGKKEAKGKKGGKKDKKEAKGKKGGKKQADEDFDDED